MTYNELQQYGVDITPEQFQDLIFLHLHTGGIYTTMDLIAMLHILGLLNSERTQDDSGNHSDGNTAQKSKDFLRDYPTEDRARTMSEFFPFLQDPTVTREIKDLNQAFRRQLSQMKRQRIAVQICLGLNVLVAVVAVFITMLH